MHIVTCFLGPRKNGFRVYHPVKEVSLKFVAFIIKYCLILRILNEVNDVPLEPEAVLQSRIFNNFEILWRLSFSTLLKMLWRYNQLTNLAVLSNGNCLLKSCVSNICVAIR
jgi:hypothetical protein